MFIPCGEVLLGVVGQTQNGNAEGGAQEKEEESAIPHAHFGFDLLFKLELGFRLGRILRLGLELSLGLILGVGLGFRGLELKLWMDLMLGQNLRLRLELGLGLKLVFSHVFAFSFMNPRMFLSFL